MDNNFDINDLNNIEQSNESIKQTKVLKQEKLNEKITSEEEQYRYLNSLNKKLILFKKQSNQSETIGEEIL